MENPCDIMSQIDRSLVEIDTKFHDYSMSFIQGLFVFHAGTWHGFWISSSHGISMAFPKKMMGFPSDLVSFLTKAPSKIHEESRVTFFTGILFFAFSWKNLIFSKKKKAILVKNLTRVLSCLFDGSLFENNTKSDGNPIIFIANAMKIPWLDVMFQHGK